MLRRRVVQHSCVATHNQSDSGSGGSGVCNTAFLWSNSQSDRQWCRGSSVYMHKCSFCFCLPWSGAGLAADNVLRNFLFLKGFHTFPTATYVILNNISFLTQIQKYKMLQHSSCARQETLQSLQQPQSGLQLPTLTVSWLRI